MAYAPDPDGEGLWSFTDTSKYLIVPVATLKYWRHRNEGPPAVKLGKHIRYVPAEVRAWVESQRSEAQK